MPWANSISSHNERDNRIHTPEGRDTIVGDGGYRWRVTTPLVRTTVLTHWRRSRVDRGTGLLSPHVRQRAANVFARNLETRKA